MDVENENNNEYGLLNISGISSGWGWHSNSTFLYRPSSQLVLIKQYEANQIKWKKLYEWSLQFHKK